MSGRGARPTPRRGGDNSFVPPAVRERIREGAVPLARALGSLGLTPDALTLIGFAVAIVAALAAALGFWLPAGALVLFGGLFDLLDGALARAQNATSAFGAFMDSTFDRWGEAVVYAGVVAGLLGQGRAEGAAAGAWSASELVAILAVAAMAAAFMVSYTRARAEGLRFEAAVGVAPRAERIVLISAGLILQPVTGWSLALALALILVLATITVVQRVAHVRAQARTVR